MFDWQLETKSETNSIRLKFANLYMGRVGVMVNNSSSLIIVNEDDEGIGCYQLKYD